MGENLPEKNFYSLPELPYAYNSLGPLISEMQLRLHHDKHHAAYVNGANAILERLDKARQTGAEIDMKATLKELSLMWVGILCIVYSGQIWHLLPKPEKNLRIH
jgi:superoxide dismutase